MREGVIKKMGGKFDIMAYRARVVALAHLTVVVVPREAVKTSYFARHNGTRNS